MKVVIIGAKNPETGRMMSAIRANIPDGQERPDFIGFIDNNPALHGTEFLGLPVFGGFERLDDFIDQGCLFVNTVGATTVVRYETSMAVAERGGQFLDFIHPSVERPASLGIANYIQGSVHIQADVAIGDNAYINVGTVIAHQSILGNSVFIAQLTSICGEVTIGDGVYIGTNASILPRLKIGPWATIGAGSVVLKDVPAYAVVVGNPGRIIRYSEKRYSDGAIRRSNV
jgi:sugar O-acyltransferase (sialic acid O-acetyltransferase NeuD family)